MFSVSMTEGNRDVRDSETNINALQAQRRKNKANIQEKNHTRTTYTMTSTNDLENEIQYYFTDKALLQEALLTSGNDHSCNAVEVGKPANKRLALVGDAVLRLAIVDHWWEQGDSSRRTQFPTY
jgi:hypothetical protein